MESNARGLRRAPQARVQALIQPQIALNQTRHHIMQLTPQMEHYAIILIAMEPTA